MAESETSSLVFRSTSLTMRQRLTPDSACSTRTRMRHNFRLVRFSAAVSSPPRGFFFRLARFRHRRLVSLESAVLVQDGARRISDALLIGQALVRYPAGSGLAQKVDAPAVGGSDDDVLVAVRLLTAAVVRRLFFRVFRPLAPPLRAVDDAPHRFAGRWRGLGEGPRVALRQGAHFVEGVAQDGQEL